MSPITVIVNTKIKYSNLFISLCKNFYLNLKEIFVT